MLSTTKPKPKIDAGQPDNVTPPDALKQWNDGLNFMKSIGIFNQAGINDMYDKIPGLKDLDKNVYHGNLYFSAMEDANNAGNGLTNTGVPAPATANTAAANDGAANPAGTVRFGIPAGGQAGETPQQRALAQLHDALQNPAEFSKITQFPLTGGLLKQPSPTFAFPTNNSGSTLSNTGNANLSLQPAWKPSGSPASGYTPPPELSSVAITNKSRMPLPVPSFMLTPNINKAPAWSGVGQTTAFADTANEDTVVISPWNDGKYHVTKIWAVDGSTTPEGDAFDTIGNAKAYVAKNWDFIANGPTMGQGIMSKIHGSNAGIGANTLRLFTDFSPNGNEDPYAVAQDIADHPENFDGQIQKEADGYSKVHSGLKPSNPGANPYYPFITYSSPGEDQAMKVLDLKDNYKGMILASINQYRKRGYDVSQLELNPYNYGVQPIPADASDYDRQMARITLLNKLGLVDDSIPLAAQTTHLVGIVQKDRDLGKSDDAIKEDIYNFIGGIPYDAAGKVISAIPGIGQMYDAMSAYSGNANDATMEGATTDQSRLAGGAAMGVAGARDLYDLLTDGGSEVGEGLAWKLGHKLKDKAEDIDQDGLTNLINHAIYTPDTDMERLSKTAADPVLVYALGLSEGSAKQYILDSAKSGREPDMPTLLQKLQADSAFDDRAKAIVDWIDQNAKAEGTGPSSFVSGLTGKP